MTITLAEKTIAAINEALEKDQGALFRTNLKKVLPHINDAYAGAGSPFRSHLGASLIGRSCERQIWYGYRWFKRPSFPGRIIRLFNRGHLEEGRVIAALLTIGVQIYQQDSNGKQYRISDCYGHFGGSGDGVALNIPDLPPGTYALMEFKTHGKKSFILVVSKGVKEAKPEHYVQMQVYMEKMGLKVCLYVAVCKDDDELYMELVYADSIVANLNIEKAQKIIFSRTPPQKINSSPSWYECKYCEYISICHYNVKTQEKNCRTCYWSNPDTNGTWVCNQYHKVLDENAQLYGCSEHTPL
jgi:hypothetical protein